MNEKKADFLSMRQAIAIGNQSRTTSPPNPWVGSVIVKNGQTIGEGATSPFGGDHAEVVALKAAGSDAKGATLYTTLEPCSHHGKTPPCVEAIIQHQVERVVVALKDPDPNVNGSGIAKLRQHGVKVDVGFLEKEAKDSLLPYLHHRLTGKTFVIAKAAMSLDGALAAKDGSSKWITCKKARQDAHKLRAESQAILVGSATALADNPKLTVRNVDSLPNSIPLRVLLDSKGKVPATHALFDQRTAPTLVFTSNRCKKQTRIAWENCGAEVEEIDIQSDHLDLNHVLKNLGKRGVIQTLFETGPTLLNALFNQNLINRFTLYVGPKVLGKTPYTLFPAVNIQNIAEAPQFKLIDVQKFTDTVRLDYEHHDAV